jgi:RNA polymerase sigma-70 factor, ECF subfamily
MSLSDEQCVRSCLNDHPEAFRLLVERYQAPLMRYLCARSDDRDEAEEIGQEAFVRAYFALRALRKPESFLAWLFGIADRVAKEGHHATRRRRSMDWEQVDPAELVERPEKQEDSRVAEALARLPDVYREVVLLRYYDGHSCAEISRTLDVPVGTVTKRLSRAYALLREVL